MKRFFSNLWCLALTITLSTACSNDEQILEEVSQTSQAISAEEALENLNTFLGYTSTRSPKQLPDTKDMLVFRSNDATRTGEAKGEAYIVNFKEGGYAILGGNTAQASVMAVVEKGFMTPEKLMADLKVIESGKEADALTHTNACIAAHILATPVGTEIQKSESTRASDTEFQEPLVISQWGTGAPFNAKIEAIALGQILASNAWLHDRCPQSINGKARPWNPILRLAQELDLNNASTVDIDAVSNLLSDINKVITGTDSAGRPWINNSTIVDMLNKIGGGYKNAKALIVYNPLTKEVNLSAIRDMVFTKKLPAYVSSTNTYYPYSIQKLYIITGWMKAPSPSGNTTEYYICTNYCKKGEGDSWYRVDLFYGTASISTQAQFIITYE